MRLRWISGCLVLLLVAGQADAQLVPVDQVCEVTSTRQGRWYNVNVACGDQETLRVRLPETFRSCPPIAGDRVRVRSMNEDGTGGLIVTGFESRVLGEWCANPVGPVTLTGPCYIEEDPPREEREEQLGAKWTRAVVTTMIRWYDDGRRSIGPGGCTPLRLSHGAYRLYVSEAVRTGVWGPCPAGVVPGPTGLCQQATNRETWFEGGVRVDSLLAELPAQSAAAFVPGWDEETVTQRRVRTKLITFKGASTPVRLRIASLSFAGAQVPVTIRTNPIRFSGADVPIPIRIDRLTFSGAKPPIPLRMSRLYFAGAELPIRVRMQKSLTFHLPDQD